MPYSFREYPWMKAAAQHWLLGKQYERGSGVVVTSNSRKHTSTATLTVIGAF